MSVSTPAPYTILDLTRVLSGPFGTMLLGDLGFRVIKVEEARLGDTTRHNPPYREGVSAYFLSVNRNKESIVLDLKDPRGREVLLDLARRADAVVENFRPDVMAGLGLSFDELRKANPRLVLVSINGFGSDGPLRDTVSFDVIAQAMSGAMAVTTPDEGEPIKPAIPLADLGAGLFATLSVLTELLRQRETEEGSHTEVSLHDVMLALSSRVGEALLRTGGVATATQRPLAEGIFATADGHIALAAYTPALWPLLCDLLGCPELAERQPPPGTPAEASVTQGLRAALQSRSTAHWLAAFAAAGIPAGAVPKLGQVMRDPAVEEAMITHLNHPVAGSVAVLGNPIRREYLPYRHDPLPPPRHGQHTLALLTELGYSQQRIDELVAAKVVAGLTPEPDV